MDPNWDSDVNYELTNDPDPLLLAQPTEDQGDDAVQEARSLSHKSGRRDASAQFSSPKFPATAP